MNPLLLLLEMMEILKKNQNLLLFAMQAGICTESRLKVFLSLRTLKLIFAI